MAKGNSPTSRGMLSHLHRGCGCLWRPHCTGFPSSSPGGAALQEDERGREGRCSPPHGGLDDCAVRAEQADPVQSRVITKQPKPLEGLDLGRGKEKGRGHAFERGDELSHGDEGWQEALGTEQER